MATNEALIAHVLRRATFGPYAGQVEKLLPGGVSGAIDAVLAAPPIKWNASGPLGKTETDTLAQNWITRMINEKAGIHEKMTWFWHGHFTSAGVKVGSAGLMAQQHNLLRANALGNFREFLYRITIDPAMLYYLDGAGSEAIAPNENFSREVMELYTIGRTAGYTQTDVVNGARALSGWDVDGKTSYFDADRGYSGSPLPYLGTTVRNAREVTDACCNHASCAPFIVTKLYRYLAGVDPTTAKRDALATTFKNGNLEIRPVVEAIVRDPTFLDMRMNRPRFPVEWVTATRHAAGINNKKDLFATCDEMGQTPFEPPNVAGWAPGPRWLSASQVLARTGLAVQAKVINDVKKAADPVAAALKQCSLYEVSDATRGTLQTFAAGTSNVSDRALGLVALAVASPEFALA